MKNFDFLKFFTTHADVCDPGSAADIRVFTGINPLNLVLNKEKIYFQASDIKYLKFIVKPLNNSYTFFSNIYENRWISLARFTAVAASS